LKRRHLDASQRAAIAVELAKQFTSEAAARQQEGRRRGGKTAGRSRRKAADSSPAKLPASDRHERESRARAAKTMDVSATYVSRASEIKRQSLEVGELLDAGKVKITHATELLRLGRDDRQKAVEAIKAGANPVAVLKPRTDAQRRERGAATERRRGEREALVEFSERFDEATRSIASDL